VEINRFEDLSLKAEEASVQAPPKVEQVMPHFSNRSGEKQSTLDYTRMIRTISRFDFSAMGMETEEPVQGPQAIHHLESQGRGGVSCRRRKLLS
jgi:hypothetical protein